MSKTCQEMSQRCQIGVIRCQTQINLGQCADIMTGSRHAGGLYMELALAVPYVFLVLVYSCKL